MFESRPLEVDEKTAIGVARAEGLEWLAGLNDAVVAGRLPEGYGVAPVTPVLSDVVPEPALRIDVAQALGTCELALVVADVAPEALGACAPDAARCLIHDVVFEAAREHCTSPDRELAWRRLARAMVEPMRSRCERLADACRATPGLDPAA